MANRFVSNRTRKLELSDGDWIEVAESLDYESFKEIYSILGKSNDNLAVVHPLLKKVLKDWSFKDENDQKVPVTPEKIDLLNVAALNEIVSLLVPIYLPEKKSSKQLNQVSKEESQLPLHESN